MTPSGKGWLHEIKHDGFRVIARKTNKRVRLYSRSGNDLTYRFPLIVDAMARLGVQSCIIDGHSHATQLLLDGVHPKIAQERLGHASIATTLDLYSHVTDTMQHDAAARLDAAFQSAINRLSDTK
jgi:integrase